MTRLQRLNVPSKNGFRLQRRKMRFLDAPHHRQIIRLQKLELEFETYYKRCGRGSKRTPAQWRNYILYKRKALAYANLKSKMKLYADKI